MNDAEAKRLSALGYVVDVAWTDDDEYAEEKNFLVLHATYDQLKNFSAAESLGYSVMLYDEYSDHPLAFYAPNFSGFSGGVHPRNERSMNA